LSIVLPEFWQRVLVFTRNITAQVGVRLLADFGQAQAQEKADGSLVTQSDRWADDALRQAIATTFPDHGVLSEEVAHTFPATDWCWVIDPVDGTTNFTRGIPIWGISLGLLHQGIPVFGYVHLPPLNQSFYGFWVPNAQPLPDQPVASQALICDRGQTRLIHTTTDPVTRNHCFNLCARSTQVLQNPFPCKIRMLGVATYNLLTVALGAAQGGVEATPKIWDIAAVWAIVQAAGGSWISLGSEAIFPLVPGENYGDRLYPTLVVSRVELVPLFQPLVACVGTKVST